MRSNRVRKQFGYVYLPCTAGHLILQARFAYNPQPMTEELVIDRSGEFPLHEVLSLQGPLTASNAPIFQNALRREEPAPTLILDLSDVPYVDSAGLGLLVSAFVSRQKAGRKMILSGINPRVQKLFEITRMQDLFLIFASPEEAIAALQGAAEA
jgi:anti-sigma B factor antagonist